MFQMGWWTTTNIHQLDCKPTSENTPTKLPKEVAPKDYAPEGTDAVEKDGNERELTPDSTMGSQPKRTVRSQKTYIFFVMNDECKRENFQAPNLLAFFQIWGFAPVNYEAQQTECSSTSERALPEGSDEPSDWGIDQIPNQKLWTELSPGFDQHILDEPSRKNHLFSTYKTISHRMFRNIVYIYIWLPVIPWKDTE